MAKLPRRTQKIFGVNAPVNQITAFGSVKAGDVEYTQDVGQIQTDAFTTGWAAAVQDDYAPYRQDRNALDLVTTKQLAYLFQEGIPEWDAGTTYYKGGLVKYINGTEIQLFISLIDNNINNPITEVESWKLLNFKAVWGQITGNVTDQTDLMNYLDQLSSIIFSPNGLPEEPESGKYYAVPEN